ncbi:MAG: hypothetical protein M3P23_04465 [Actinomycetota bacterium]|nr:hypothetical protein [Actinomycetota bacterium]
MADEQARVERWWSTLTEAQRERVRAHMHGPLPPDLVVSMVRCGLSANTYWLDAAQKRPMHAMPDAVARFMREYD